MARESTSSTSTSPGFTRLRKSPSSSRTGKSRRSSLRQLTPVFPEHADDAAGHIFAAVVADAFHHGDGAGLRTAKRRPRGLAAYRRPPVAPYRQVPIILASWLRNAEPTGGRMASRPPAMPFPDVVVGVASQMQFHAAGVPHAEALPAVPLSERRSVARQSLVAMGLGDIPGQRGPTGGRCFADIKPNVLLCFSSTYGFACCSSWALSTPLSNSGLFSCSTALCPDAALRSQAVYPIQFLLLGGEPIQPLSRSVRPIRSTRRWTPSWAISSRVSRAINSK